MLEPDAAKVEHHAAHRVRLRKHHTTLLQRGAERVCTPDCRTTQLAPLPQRLRSREQPEQAPEQAEMYSSGLPSVRQHGYGETGSSPAAV
jgi:hypothetical protein